MGFEPTTLGATDRCSTSLSYAHHRIVLHLHAADVAALTITSEATPVAKNAVCTGLRGRSTRVSYHLVQGQPWEGEIQSIELRK